MDAVVTPTDEASSGSSDVYADYPTSTQLGFVPLLSYVYIISMVFIGLGITLNFFVIVAFFKHIEKKTLTNCLICSICSSDLITLTSGAILAFFVFTETGITIASRSKSICLTYLSTSLFGLLQSLAAIFFLSLQRLMAVLTPDRFREQNRREALVAFVIFPVCLSAVIASLPSFGWNHWVEGKRCTLYNIHSPSYLRSFFIGPCAFILITIPLIKLSTFATLIRQQRKVHAFQGGKSSKKKQSVLLLTIKENWQVSKMLLIIVSTFYVCFLPYTVLIIASRVREDLFVMYPSLRMAFEVSKPLIAANSAINPVIYGCTNSQFRDAFRKIFKKIP